MKASELIEIIGKLVPSECQCFLEELPFALPLTALFMLAEGIAKEIESKTEKAAMQAAVLAADASVDVAEANDIKLGPNP